MPVEGQEDDDFAYEDEHIELESDNEEYEPLDEGEFDSRSALIKAELKAPILPGSVAPESGVKPVERERAPKSQSAGTSAQNNEASPNIPPAASAHSVGSQAPKIKRAKPPTKARAQPPAKSRVPSRATKRTQPVRKKVAKPAKKTLRVKVARSKKSSLLKKKPVKKKAAPKAAKKGMRSRPALTKKRRS
jgi:hypothetical protein